LVWLLCLLPGAAGACAFVEAARDGPDAPAALAFPDGVDGPAIRALLPCLGHPEPVVRDDFAYGVFATALREGRASIPALRVLRDALVAGLAAPPDPGGFRRPFEALVLAEVARTDRIDPWMGAGERAELVTVAVAYLRSVNDFRGFDPVEGWRHGIAHGADLLLQLALHPALAPQDGERILGAVADRVAPAGTHPWVFGEPDRLARPVLWLARAHPRSPERWDAFFASLAPDLREPRWRAPYRSAEGLAALHNTRAFARAVFTAALRSDEPALRPLADGAAALLDALP
jgi:hypothetical protein